MKLIQSFFLISICLGTTNLLHAQEIKASLTKPAETKVPPVVVTASPQPDFIPQPGSVVTPTQPASAAGNTAPSPFNKDEAGKVNNKPNLQVAIPVPAPATDTQTAIRPQTVMQPDFLRQQKN